MESVILKIVLCAMVIFPVSGTFGREITQEKEISLRELELANGVVVEIKSAVKLDQDTLMVTLENGREGKVHRHKLSPREEKRRFGSVVIRAEEEQKKTEEEPKDGPPVGLQLSSGKTISVVRAKRLNDKMLAIKLENGKCGKIERSKLCERDQLRCFGPLPPPDSKPNQVEMLSSGLPSDFDCREFTKRFVVQPEDLKNGTFKTPFYKMPFRYFVPENIPTGIRVPMVVFLHGVMEGGYDNLKQLKHRQPLIFVQPWIQEKYPCFFVAPQLNKKGPWCGSSGGNELNATEELQIVVAIIDELQQNFPAIDPDRIYLTGLSSGGLGVFEALAKYPGKFAGGVPASAGYFPFARKFFRPQRAAVWAFLNPNERRTLQDDCHASLEKIVEQGGIARETKFSIRGAGGHQSWYWVYAEPDLIPWLFSHRRERKKEEAE